MRNTIVRTLKPGATLIIDVDPPIAEDEQYYMLAPPALGPPVVVRVIDDAQIVLANPHDCPAFVILSIGPVFRLPVGILEGLSAFVTARKKLR